MRLHLLCLLLIGLVMSPTVAQDEAAALLDAYSRLNAMETRINNAKTAPEIYAIYPELNTVSRAIDDAAKSQRAAADPKNFGAAVGCLKSMRDLLLQWARYAEKDLAKGRVSREAAHTWSRFTGARIAAKSALDSLGPAAPSPPSPSPGF